MTLFFRLRLADVELTDVERAEIATLRENGESCFRTIVAALAPVRGGSHDLDEEAELEVLNRDLGFPTEPAVSVEILDRYRRLHDRYVAIADYAMNRQYGDAPEIATRH